MKKSALIILYFILFHSALFSQSKYGSDIFNLAKDPGGESLGSAVVAGKNGVYSLLWNPAGLNFTGQTSFAFIHSQMFISDFSYNFLGTAFSYLHHNIGIAMIRIGIDNIKNTLNAIIDGELYYPAIETVNVSDYLFLFGIAPTQRSQKFKYGVTFKYIYRDYNIETASGFGIDLGILYNILPNLTFGVKYANSLGSIMLWSTGKKEWIRPELSYGLEYKYSLKDFLTFYGYLNVFTYFDNRQKTAAYHLGFISGEPATGIKISYKNKIAVNGGMDQLGHFTYGAELHIPSVIINYSGYKHQSLGQVQNVGIRLIIKNQAKIQSN